MGALDSGDAEIREQAARELGESGDPRAARYLIASLGDDSPAVSVASVRALDRLGEPSAVMPLYEFARNELADPVARRAAAEALVKLGLLRRERTGPSAMFMWLAGMTLVVVAVGAASILGPAAIAVFVVGAGALGVYALRQLGSRSDVRDTYVGPHGEQIRVGSSEATAAGGGNSWFDGWGDGGGGNGGGGG